MECALIEARTSARQRTAGAGGCKAAEHQCLPRVWDDRRAKEHCNWRRVMMLSQILPSKVGTLRLGRRLRRFRCLDSRYRFVLAGPVPIFLLPNRQSTWLVAGLPQKPTPQMGPLRIRD